METKDGYTGTVRLVPIAERGLQIVLLPEGAGTSTFSTFTKLEDVHQCLLALGVADADLPKSLDEEQFYELNAIPLEQIARWFP